MLEAVALKNTEDYGNIKLELGLLKKDIISVNEVCRKLDTTIDKLQELTASITKMLSLHEQRLEYQEKKDAELDKLIELRRTELLTDIKELHSRITTVNKELTSQIEQTENKITQEIKSLRDCITANQNKSDTTIEKIQQWKWGIVGGLAALVWLASNVNFSAVGKLFK
jgi:predicted  nucleic acid-binding Zn-ribbon protein